MELNYCKKIILDKKLLKSTNEFITTFINNITKIEKIFSPSKYYPSPLLIGRVRV